MWRQNRDQLVENREKGWYVLISHVREKRMLPPLTLRRASGTALAGE